MNRRVHSSLAARSAIIASWWRSLANQAAVNWGDVAQRLPFAADMKACVQDATYHAEGDVWTHTIAVVEQVLRNRARAGVADDRWAVLFLAALLHDIAKPATRSEEFDAEGRPRVHHYGHARMGALMAWEFLWRLGLPRPRGKQIFHLVRWHQRPFHLTFAPALERDVITQAGNWRELLALARADNLGRIAPNTAETAASLDLLEGEIVKRACMDGPWRFPSDDARLWFGRAAGRSPWFEPPAPTGSHVVVLCGLPGAGMDTHCRKAFPDWPQVSLDQLRQALEVLPNDN
jgi:HD domain